MRKTENEKRKRDSTSGEDFNGFKRSQEEESLLRQSVRLKEDLLIENEAKEGGEREEASTLVVVVVVVLFSLFLMSSYVCENRK